MHISVYVKFHLHLQSYLSNWHIIYVVNYIRSNINVQHLLFAHVQTTATAGPDQPEPSSSPAVLPARNGQCRIHARPERTRPLTGIGIEAARRPRERRPRRFRVHAAAPRSKVAIAGYNMRDLFH